MSRFQLGARVSISGTAVKRKTWAPNYFRIRVTYEEGPPPSRTYYPNEMIFTEGIIVGSRTIQDGKAFWEDGTSHYQPDSGTARNVWLVAFDLRMKPALCFDHQVDAVEPNPCGHAALGLALADLIECDGSLGDKADHLEVIADLILGDAP